MASTPSSDADAPAESAAASPRPPSLSLEGVAPLAWEGAAPAREAFAKGDLLEAARRIEASLAEAEPAEARALRLHAAAACRARGGDPAGAARGFERAADLGGPLAPISALFAAELATELGRAGDAAARLAALDPALVTPKRLDRARLRAALALRDHAAARPLVEALRDEPRRDRAWGDDALRTARALLASPRAEQVRDALGVALAVRDGAADARQGERARQLVDEALARLPHAERVASTRPSPDAQLDRAERLVAAGRLREATTQLDALAKRKPAFDGERTCRLSLAHARALGGTKRTGEAADRGAEAATRCEGGPSAATALWVAGTTAARAKRHAEAERWLAALEARFPEDRLADDAALEGGRAALARGDLDGARARLADAHARYPSGDLAGDALFTWALALFERGDASGALASLEQGRSRPIERAWHRAGRFDYFAGRALDELGRGREAEAAYRATLTRAPGGYYAALALARIGAGRQAEARRVIEAYLASAPEAEPPELPAEAAHDPGWAAAIAATRAGDGEALTLAFDALGVGARRANEASILTAAELHARLGDATSAHRLLRTAGEIEPSTGRLEAWSMRDAGPRGPYRRAWELAYPRSHAAEAERAAREAGIPLALVFAIMREESAFDPKAVSRSDARGLMQLLPVTGSHMARGLGLRLDDTSLFDPAINARLGARFLAQLRRRFDGAEALAVPGYNAGPGAPERWLEERPGQAFDLWVEAIPYAETRGYTKRVLSSLFVYELLTGGEPTETLRLPLVVPAPSPR